jgi:hypothetical protein
MHSKNILIYFDHRNTNASAALSMAKSKLLENPLEAQEIQSSSSLHATIFLIKY